MKRIAFFAALLLTTFSTVYAQNDNASRTSPRYVAAMEKQLAILDTANTATTWQALANQFDRIATVEKLNWEAYYYTAYCYVLMAANNPEQADVLADKAETSLTKADSLQPRHSEIKTLFALVYAVQLGVDPMGRYQTLIPQVERAVSDAKQLDASNPRAYLVDARFRSRLPEMMGGGKEAALKLVNQSIEKFGVFKPANSIAPRWGLESARQLLSKLNTPG